MEINLKLTADESVQLKSALLSFIKLYLAQNEKAFKNEIEALEGVIAKLDKAQTEGINNKYAQEFAELYQNKQLTLNL